MVVQDVRGRFNSDGGFEPFRDEADGGYDTDSWLVTVKPKKKMGREGLHVARLPYADRDSASPEVREVFRNLEQTEARVANVYRMVGHSRAALLRLVGLGYALLTGAELDAKLREIAVLRVAMLGGSQSEWERHVVRGRQGGVSDAQIADLAQWAGSSAFDEKEEAVLAYVDEMMGDSSVKDNTFARVSGFLNETEIVELTLSALFWGMMARFLVALQVDANEGTLRLG